jgi:hypothetical protein
MSEGGAGGPDRRAVAIGILSAAIVAATVTLAVVRAGGSGDEGAPATSSSVPGASTSTTATPSSSSSTSAATTTTTTSTSVLANTTTTVRLTTTTTTAPPRTTIDRERCTGRAPPDDPRPVARTFYDAWTVGDRRCARAVASREAVEDLFVYDGTGAEWELGPCEALDRPEPRSECRFDYEGGFAVLDLRFGAVDGWVVRAITFEAERS